MTLETPAEVPPEGMCTRSRCYQEAREVIDEISQSEYYSYLKKSERLLAKPLQENNWDSSRHLVGECMTFLRATPQERFRKAMIDGDVCYSCLTRGCPTGRRGRCLNRNWALVCSQCKDEEDFMHMSRPGWKPKNVLLCERHKATVNVERWLELFPLTVEGKGYIPLWRSPFPIESKSSEEFLRASFNTPPKRVEKK